jgi:hypothetical protein
MVSFDGALCPLSPLNLVTLEYTKKFDPYIYDFVYTPVIIGLTRVRMSTFPFGDDFL